MSRELSGAEIGVILAPLERRFKSLSNGQAEVYHERLKYQPEKYLKMAVEYFVDFGKAFPSPGELKKATWKERDEDPTYKEESTEVEGCAHCRKGWVSWTIPSFNEHTAGRIYQYYSPCAYCHKEHNIPMVILRDGKIYWAYRELRAGKYVQDVNNLEHITGSMPGTRRDRDMAERKIQDDIPF